VEAAGLRCGDLVHIHLWRHLSRAVGNIMRGGKRHRHIPPKFNYGQAEEIRNRAAAGVCRKQLCWDYGCSLSTLKNVLYRKDAYK
jgi:hypothetical protein